MKIIDKIKLRSKQINNVFFSGNFISNESLVKAGSKGYQSEEEVEYYQDVTFSGIGKNEIEAIEAAIEDLKIAHPKVLVVGCGTGREAFAFEKMGLNVYAMDINIGMIKKAQELSRTVDSKIKYFCDDFPHLDHLDGKVDIVFLSAFLVEMIYGKDNRINYYKKLHSIINPGGLVCTMADIERPSPRYLEYYASKVLWIQSLLKGWKWERGDIIKSTMKGDGELIYFHQYPDKKSFTDEFEAAGWQGRELSFDYWILSSQLQRFID